MICTNNVCKGALSCVAPTANCDGNDSNGCEANTDADPKNCGKCGMVCPVDMGACVAGVCKALLRVLLLHTEPKANADRAKDVQDKLLATGKFVIDTFDTSSVSGQVPDVATLQRYDAILVWGGSLFKDADGLGDNLATYFESGGRVVVAQTAHDQQATVGLGGAFAAKYSLMARAKTVGDADSLGVIDEPMSPLVADVKNLAGSAVFGADSALLNGATVVAHWGSGRPLIVRGTVKNRRRVDLNFWPVSNDGFMGAWTGDGAAILRNALLYQ
jgi:hypothetical protein